MKYSYTFLLKLPLFLLSLSTPTLFAQVTFQRTFHYFPQDQGVDVVEASNGNFVAVSTQSNGYNTILIRGINASGDSIWSKKYEGSSAGVGLLPKAILQTADGGYVVIIDSITCPVIACLKVLYAIKVDASGNRLWSKQVSTTDANYQSCNPTADGGYIIITSPYNGSLITKVDADFNEQWHKLFVFPFHHIREIEQTENGDYLAVGGGYYGTNHLILLKINALGDTLWTRQYGEDSYNSSGTSIEPDNNGQFYILGNTRPLGTLGDIYLSKADANGVLLWTKNYGTDSLDAAISLKKNTNGDLFIFGSENGVGSGQKDLSLYRTNANGELLWHKTLGTPLDDFPKAFSLTADGGLLVIGTSNLPSPIPFPAPQNSDVYIAKLDENGNIVTSAHDLLLENIVASPNPFNTEIFVKSPQSPIISYQLVDVNGKEIFSAKLPAPFETLHLHCPATLPNGIYMLLLSDGERVFCKKLVKH